MKKSLIYSLVAVAMLACLSGCGSKSKTLNCSMSSDQTGMKMDQKIKATFKGDEVKKISMNINVEIDSEYKSYVDMMVTSVESSFKNFKDKKGVTTETKKNDKGFVLTFEADLDKMDKETKEELDMVDSKSTYSEAKKEFEKEGYTCK